MIRGGRPGAFIAAAIWKTIAYLQAESFCEKLT
jgi:hypothetical protein